MIKTTEIKKQDFPLIQEYTYKPFDGVTYRDLVEYTIELQNDYKQCIGDINIIKEWYIDR